MKERQGYNHSHKKRMLLRDATLLGLRMTSRKTLVLGRLHCMILILMFYSSAAKSFVELTRYLFTMKVFVRMHSRCSLAANGKGEPLMTIQMHWSSIETLRH